jgi:serine/threonine protein kinase
MKTYEKKNLIDNATKEAVQKEINILAGLNHPHIMGLYEVIDTRTNVSLVMELCNGKSLFHYIKKKPNQKLPESECKLIF